ncbi:MAG TPA: CAP domain-containing protein [Pyrinomonadaceae bacterium]|nr:CAP domain-containing protein [Pyrinomonadaceae bacterium]
MHSSRRAFLKSASASLGVALLDPLSSSSGDLEKTFAEIRANLLEMVNEERAVAKVRALAIDELATEVATKHAIDMALGEFASHWDRDGLKPYHRYSFAGGTHATQENISAADNTWSTKLADLKQDTAYLHVRLYQEKPPYDGHHRTILAPQHTHVGFGLAVEQLRLRLVELFVAKHVQVEPIRRTAKPGAEIFFSGKVLNRESVLDQVEVFYEPWPKPPELSWLREPRSYSLPKESRVLRPKVSPPLTYVDGSRGVIDVSLDGSFRAPVKLYEKDPGIYTIVAWLKNRSDKAFPATEVCIKAL